MDVRTLGDQEIEYYIKEYAARIYNGVAIDDSKLMLDNLFSEREIRKRNREDEERLHQDELYQKAIKQGSDPNTFINNETINLGSEPII